MSSKENMYTKGTRVWLSDPGKVWKSGEVSEDFVSGFLSVINEDGKAVKLEIKDPKTLPPLRNPDILIGQNDLTSLSYLHEPAVMYNLSYRFCNNNCIYTYCGIVLVAINPYEDMPIYNSDTVWAYRGQAMGDLDPHIFATAEEAYTKMERDGRDQSIIVSGESGAGKTVSAKYAMRYFATVGGSENETQIERKVIASSPIMEAIGNAKTTRNDNSSRFGKYVELHFDKKYGIMGGSMRTYLLEKSRVVFQSEDERNYHIFYQMCSSRNIHAEVSDLYLDISDKFSYTNQGGDGVIDGVCDNKSFIETVEALTLLGFGIDYRRNLFKLLAAILHLGNIEFHSSNDKEVASIAKDDEDLSHVCTLLSLDFDNMRKWLCHRKLVSGKEEFIKPMNIKDCHSSRDALAKMLYAEAFNNIVEGINKSLKTDAPSNRFIGVLDIYGFETFEINSFEQFCINYANEKLQQQFNQHVFKLEQEEYVKEGIEWTFIEFYDNQPCIDLIESKLGILDLLDEECRMPQGSDHSWALKLYDKCKRFEQFSKPRISDHAFIILHFADKVTYQSSGFLEKNRDTVLLEQMNTVQMSKNEWLLGILRVNEPVPKAKGKAPSGTLTRKKTVGSQFRDSLTLLMTSLNATTPHYVRCIKPNDEKLAFIFEPHRAVQQLRACGVLETVRISAAGFPSRWTYPDFFSRYRVLCHSKDVNRSDYKSTCENIVQNIMQDLDDYRFGRTKIFFRAGQVAFMEKKRIEKLRYCGVIIQKNVKMWIYRNRYKKIKTSVSLLQRYGRGLLARRTALRLRQTKASITIQKYLRCFIEQRRYKQIRTLTLGLQCLSRGFLARKRAEGLRRVKAVIVIQKYTRGFLEKQRYNQSLRNVVVVQSCIRRFLARRMFKKLKTEARSLEHVKSLNKGLENKIIYLQQKMDEITKEACASKNLTRDYKSIKSELEQLKPLEVQYKNALKAIEELQAAKCKLEIQLKTEIEEKVDLVSWKNKLEEEKKAMKLQTNELEKRIDDDTKQLKTLGDYQEEILKLKNNLNLLEKDRESEQLAYQQLLKKFHSAEGKITTLEQGGGVSGKSPVPLPRRTVKEEPTYDSGIGDSKGFIQEDMGLIFLLQQKLTDVEAERDALQKVHIKEEMSPESDKRRTQDLIRLQELEMENAKLRDDLQRLRSSINVEGNGKEELYRQFNSMQEELSRKREESIQLRTVLASPNKTKLNGDDEDEIGLILQTQKTVIQQLEKELHTEITNRIDNEKSYKEEIEKLRHENQLKEEILAGNLKADHGDSTNSNAYLTHQAKRLTKENLTLREKNNKLMLELQRLRSNEDNNHSLEDPTREINLHAVVRKKERDYSGMLEYKKDDEGKILRALILELQPAIALRELPGLPAYAIFMLIRYTDYLNDDDKVRSLLTTAIGFLKKKMMKHNDVLDVSLLWLSNILRLLHTLKQYSGDSTFQNENTAKQNEQALKNFDLSEYRQVLSDHAVWIYMMMIKILEDDIQPMIVPAILENAAIETLPVSNPRSRSHSVSSESGTKPLENLIRHLETTFGLLTSYGLDYEVIKQAFKQLFYYICAGSLNNLLLRRELCHWSKGLEIRFNVSSLEEWCRGKKMDDIMITLQPVIQASQILQARKSDNDVVTICDICDQLTVQQVIKLLNLYTSKDGFESDKVSKQFIEQVQARLISSRQEQLVGKPSSSLLMDTKFTFAVKFPFNPSAIRLEDIEIPQSFGVNQYVKRI